MSGRARVAPRVKPTIAGAAPIVDDQVVRERDGWLPRRRAPIPGQPSVFLPTATPPEEGVDAPIFTRFLGMWRQRVPLLQRILGRKKAAACYEVDFPHPIFEEPPDETPLIHTGVVASRNARAYAKGKEDASFLARRRLRLDGGIRVEIIPATEYLANVCTTLDEIQLHMLEEVDGGATWALWTEEEVRRLLYYRLCLFLMETSLILKQDTLSVSVGDGEVDVPTEAIRLVRVAWDGADLVRLDKWQLDQGTIGWEDDAGTPTSFYEEDGTVRLFPTPASAGVVTFQYVPRPEDFSTGCPHWPIPNLFVPYVKWGVIADMLNKEGEAHEPKRGAYAEARFQEGVEMAQMFLLGKGGK